jgi:hypothetical protein
MLINFVTTSQKKFLISLKKYLPYKSSRVKYDKLDEWITPDIINLMRKRDNAKYCMIAAKKQNLDSVYFENLNKS